MRYLCDNQATTSILQKARMTVINLVVIFSILNPVYLNCKRLLNIRPIFLPLLIRTLFTGTIRCAGNLFILLNRER